MSLCGHWAQRNAIKRRAIDVKLEEKRARGKMPHWSVTQMRSMNGQQMPQSHVLRPALIGDLSVTMCGWVEASFKAAGRFGFPSAQLYPATTSPLEVCSLEPNVGCPICYDVIHDIATWIELSKLRGNDGVHLAWTPNPPIAACAKQSVLLALRTEFHGDNLCPSCKAIHDRLWGEDRPEAQYTAYMTNEEAAEILRKGV